MDHKRIIEKIQKLLALSQHNTNMHESAVAAAQAQRLINKYRIDIAELNLDAQHRSEEVTEDSNSLGPYRTWRGRLAMIIARANYCGVYKAHGQLYIYGKPSNREFAIKLFKYCEFEIDFLAIIHSGRGRVWLNNFRIGCVDAVQTAIQTEQAEFKKAAQNSERALIALNNEDALLKQFAIKKGLRRSQGSAYRSDFGARQAGRIAGAGIYPQRGKLKG